jgi:hypothetical protein
MKKGWHCHWVWTFFGLSPEYKLSLHSEIFSICYYSNGGFTQSEVYKLPIHLRRFYANQLIEAKKSEKDQAAKNQSTQPRPAKLSKPGIR